MGLRPKTARRLALIAGLLVIVIIGGLAVLTVPRWQRARQIETFKRQGLAAHEAGRHYEAVPLLGRHVRAVGEENVSPEVLLSFARSQAQAEARRDSHLALAITRYRSYLRVAPDDMKARRELLTLLVRAQRWSEAVDWAERLRRDLPDGDSADDHQSVRDELAARIELNPRDEQIQALEEALLSAQPPAFQDVWAAFRYFAQLLDDKARAEDVINAYIAAWPDELGAQVLSMMQPVPVEANDTDSVVSQRPYPEIVEDLSNLLGLDGDPTTPGAVVIAEKGLPQMITGFMDRVGRTDLAAEILSQSLAGEDTLQNTNDLARRLFWRGQNDALFALARDEDSWASLSDTIGYQALAAFESGDEERAGEHQRELEATDYNYKAKAWLGVLAAKRAFKAGDLPAARAAMNDAVERHENEPTFRLLQGDVQNELGYTGEALDAWDRASFSAGSVPWDAPVVRSVSALLGAGRMNAAREMLDGVMRKPQFRTNLELIKLQIRVDALLARQGFIPEEEVVSTTLRAEAIRQVLSDQGVPLTEIDLSLANMYGVLGETAEAANALARVLESPNAADFMSDVLEIDQRFGLGLNGTEGEPELPETPSDPEAARRLALTFTDGAVRDARTAIALDNPELLDRIDRSVAFIDRGLNRAPSDQRAAWLRTRAEYLDAFRRDQAADAWRAAIEADPANLSLLNAAVWSDALGTDRGFVESTIERIRSLTDSQGRTLPASLRLARARAVFGTEPNRVQRDEAIGIARSVVAAEPSDTRARLILAQMLGADCSPIHLKTEDRFTPDLAGAIEQYQIIAAQIPGNQAVGYYFKIAELAQRLGNQARANRALDDLMSVMDERSVSIQRLATAFRDSGDPAASAAMLDRYFDATTGAARVQVGFLLLETYEAMGSKADSARVLDALAASDSLTRADLVLLASRMTQNGIQDRVEAILSDPQRLGLDDSDVAVVRATLLTRFRPIEEAITPLDALADAHPTNVEVWRVFIEALLAADMIDAAKMRIDRASEANPDDERIAFLRASADGDVDALSRLTLVGESAPRFLRVALEQVEAFERRRAGMSRDEQIAALRAITDRFSRLKTVLNYTIVEREALGEDLAELAGDAIPAARSFPSEPALLFIATRISLALGEFQNAADFATAWRAVVVGSRIEPDLYAAEAAQGLGRDDRAIGLVEPYLADALARPSEPVHAAALMIHGSSSMRSGRVSEVRARYGPLAARDPAFRASVWVPLAARWTTESQDAVAWLDAAEQWGMSGQELAIAQGWIDAAERFEDRRGEMLERAVQAADRAIESDPAGAEAYALRAGALRLLGLVERASGESSGRDWLAAAEAAFVDADRVDPTNLNMLFQAARSAEDAGRYADAERHFTQVLARPGCTGLFAAVTRNNIAMCIVRQPGSDPARLANARALTEEAIAQQPLPAFLGTRGWVRYLSGDRAGAAEDFRRSTQSNPESALAWAGLALAERGEGSGDPSPASASNWRRAIGLGLDDAFALELGTRAGFASE